MPYTDISTRVDGVDANAAADINSLMANFETFITGVITSGQFAMVAATGNFGVDSTSPQSKMQIGQNTTGMPTYKGLMRITKAGGTLLLEDNGLELLSDPTNNGYGYRLATYFDGGSGYNFALQGRDNAAAWTEHIIVDKTGDSWFIGDVSALTFTDRTPFYEGDALEEIKKIKGKDGQIDHSTLPEFTRVTKTKTEMIDDEEVETTEEHRDLGASISMNVVAIQQIIERLENLEG